MIPSINLAAVLVSVVAAFAIGFIWFGPKTFFPAWWRALGKTGDPGAEGGMALTFGLSLVGLLVQAFSLAVVIGWARMAGVDVGLFGGALIGLFVGVGFAAATSLGHRLFAGQGIKVWLIEVGGDIAALIAMGAIIGTWV